MENIYINKREQRENNNQTLQIRQNSQVLCKLPYKQFYNLESCG